MEHLKGPGARLLVVLASAAMAVGVIGGAAPSPAPAATQAVPAASCPPPADHIAIPPVGAAWIGTWEGAFDQGDGGQQIGIWDIEEVLVGDPPVVDEMLTYRQPVCDALLTGGIGVRYLVSTADVSSPTREDSVIWQLGPHGYASLASAVTSSVYDVRSLAAARALVLSGVMPAEAAPTPSPACQLDPLPSASPTPAAAGGMPTPTPMMTIGAPMDVTPAPVDTDADRTIVRTLVQGFERDLRQGRYHAAYARLASSVQDSLTFDVFRTSFGEGSVASVTHDRDSVCPWIVGWDLSNVDLSRAWVVKMRQPPHSNSGSVFLAAPDLSGRWVLMPVR